MTVPTLRRVAFVNQDVYLGGAELSLVDLMSSLGDAAPELERHLIVGFHSGPLIDRALQLGVKIHVVELPHRLASLGESALYSRGKIGMAATLSLAAIPTTVAARDYIARLRRLIDQLRPDIVHSNAMKSHLFVALGRNHAGPLIWHIRDFLRSRPLMVKALCFASSAVSRTIAISNAVGDDINGVLPRLPVDVVYNAIDVQRFSPAKGDGAELDRLAGLPVAPAGTVRVGLVATYARWKGQDLLIEAASRIRVERPHRFYVIGGPIYTTKGSQFSIEELRTLADRHQLGDRIGFVPYQTDTVQIYRSLDVVVHASTKPEPFGRTIVEAMATGRPVVISDGGGAAELFRQDYDGVGFTPGSVESLSAAVQRLIEDASLRERLGENARASAVARFNRERLGPEILKVYDRALSGG